MLPQAAQCEIPPPPPTCNIFPKLYRRGGLALLSPHFPVVSQKYRWDTPSDGGLSHLNLDHSTMDHQGRRKGSEWGGIAPRCVFWDTKTPWRTIRGCRWDSVAASRNTGPPSLRNHKGVNPHRLSEGMELGFLECWASWSLRKFRWLASSSAAISASSALWCPHNRSTPTATAILSRYTVALHSVALRFPTFGGMCRRIVLHPPEKALLHLPFQLLKSVALQVASWKVSRYRGVSQLHCRLSRYNGPLST